MQTKRSERGIQRRIRRCRLRVYARADVFRSRCLSVGGIGRKSDGKERKVGLSSLAVSLVASSAPDCIAQTFKYLRFLTL